MRCWVLNFDADDELCGLVSDTPSKSFIARYPSLLERTKVLIPSGDSLELVVNSKQKTAMRGIGIAWCPTPRVRRFWNNNKIVDIGWPTLDVLRTVNRRAFCASLGQTLPFAKYARSLEEVIAIVQSYDSPLGWVIKRDFGYSGRGRLLLKRRVFDTSVCHWITSALRYGGLQVEPWVDRSDDYALHGYLTKEGECVYGQLTQQWTDEHGSWTQSEHVVPSALTQKEWESLKETLNQTATALTQNNYWGPFGIDGFRWKDHLGQSHFHPRCEINARYTMGWAVGMAERRKDLEYIEEWQRSQHC